MKPPAATPRQLTRRERIARQCRRFVRAAAWEVREIFELIDVAWNEFREEMRRK